MAGNAGTQTLLEDSFESAARYRALFENPVVGIRISSVAEGGRIVEANLAFRKMLGYSEEELRERTIFDLTHPDDLPRTRELHEELASGRRTSYQLEKRFVRKDGSVFWGDLTLHVVCDESGRVTHHIGMVEDVSEHRRALKALKKSTEAFPGGAERDRGRHRAHRHLRHHPVDQSVGAEDVWLSARGTAGSKRQGAYAATLAGRARRLSRPLPGNWARRGSSASAGRSRAGGATVRPFPWISR